MRSCLPGHEAKDAPSETIFCSVRILEIYCRKTGFSSSRTPVFKWSKACEQELYGGRYYENMYNLSLCAQFVSLRLQHVSITCFCLAKGRLIVNWLLLTELRF